MGSRARTRAGPGQLELFPLPGGGAARAEEPPAALPGDAGLEPPQELREAFQRAAASLPAHVRLGTSSWTFPGWGGIVYPRGITERSLLGGGLRLYVANPLFGTVGVDRSYYRPLDRRTLRELVAQLPPGYPCVWKAWSEITAAVDPRTRAPNPRFLDARLCREVVLEPLLEEAGAHLGAVVFELAPLRRRELPGRAEFAARLDTFLGALPRGLPYAVELRNRELLGPEYAEVLARRGASHVFSFWERMPGVAEQLAVPGLLGASRAVCRLLLPPGVRYAEQRQRFAPFDRIVEPQPAMRDDVVRLAAACARDARTLLVLVNNKAEGSAPLTALALAERLSELGSAEVEPARAEGP